ncbi:MAG: preprotein translocase subunit SecA [Candidatus Omnitrophica bacterium CG11_big_fil_rev_8_21_14_0_20_42_13]|uniref:Protein translocase subunit SecA n=1 Tax=Candidatus Ghiorseimicrobium undicola TaxID=1974746 RepID=A0A2H0LV42_9BACT|nr:MAG: preprotein translocase subunit SecA [Candidatus Omnitrophica bacterium CG11_big_fil_rev_8_21_14_0_20_42_13]
MFNFITQKILGTQNERALRRIAPLVAAINSYEPRMQELSDSRLRAKTDEFKDKIKRQISSISAEGRLGLGGKNDAAPEEELEREIRKKEQKALDEILPEAFAVVREVGRRTINMRHFDVQLLGGIVLHEGKVAEMVTGEGKTLVATLAAYLNALTGRGVHIVTVNDYLARRDRDWMGPIYEFLGLSVGVIQHDMPPHIRKEQYACDITYGTNNEFGFDYLRDNMVISKNEMVQRDFYYSIVDEVDSILIDEARTPLIISGPTEESTDKYYIIDKIIPKLKGRIILEKDQIDAKYKGVDLSEGYDYIVDEKAHTAHLTDSGEEKACSLLNIDNLHEIETMEYRHHIIQALRAHNLYKSDVDYVIKDGKVIIVDEFTGRLMPGRRWSDGLHQAVEAKEGVKIERENQTLATVTLQNYFRMYQKLSGMTGTAMTEANEFKAIYKLDVVNIPTNKPLIRQNSPDSIYKTEAAKFKAVVEEIAECYEKGRPVLVGTISIDRSEKLSAMLKRKGIAHNVLNAKYHEMEAHIVAQAGRFRAVTIATNMAGRGTDILLGGNPEHMAKNIVGQLLQAQKDIDAEKEYKELFIKYKKQAIDEHKKVVDLGGLYIIGTERHEARRIDNQLRGRSGRQGDPGSSRFYVSLEDDLMRLFGSERIAFIMDKLGLPEDQAIEHPWISRSIETAQRRVEGHNFEIRKQLLEYDNVMNRQREVVYSRRRAVLEGKNLKEELFLMIEELVEAALNVYIKKESSVDPDWASLDDWLKNKFSLNLEKGSLNLEEKNDQELRQFLLDEITGIFNAKEAAFGAEHIQRISQIISLQIIDTKWKDHLYTMDNLRSGISLRAYGQRDPLIEYQNEAFSLFQEMIDSIRDEVIESLFKVEAAPAEKELKGVFTSLRQEFVHPEARKFEKPQAKSTMPSAEINSVNTGSSGFSPPDASGNIASSKVGRNDPCPCGSGKKYKKCCGK